MSSPDPTPIDLQISSAISRQVSAASTANTIVASAILCSAGKSSAINSTDVVEKIKATLSALRKEDHSEQHVLVHSYLVRALDLIEADLKNTNSHVSSWLRLIAPPDHAQTAPTAS